MAIQGQPVKLDGFGTFTPVIESEGAGENRLFANPDRKQVEDTAAFLEDHREELDYSYHLYPTEFGKDELEIIMNGGDPADIADCLGRLRELLVSNHLENGAFTRISVYFKFADRGKSLYTSMKYSIISGKMELDRFVVYGIEEEERDGFIESVYDCISSDEYYSMMIRKEKEELFQ